MSLQDIFECMVNKTNVQLNDECIKILKNNLFYKTEDFNDTWLVHKVAHNNLITVCSTIGRKIAIVESKYLTL